MFRHGGKNTALYAGKHIVKTIESTKQWQEYIKTGCKNLDLLEDALKEGFKNIDSNIKQEQTDRNNSGPGANDISGCTANTAIITPTHILCANAGDSRCVLSTKSRGAQPMSFDHKPHDELEKKRIEAAGGTVYMKRVDGDLAVSRTFGDFAYKQRSDLPDSEQKVSNVPDVTRHNRDNTEDEFIILACDGLWDVFTNEDCVNFIRQILINGENNPMLVCEELLDMAIEKSK